MAGIDQRIGMKLSELETPILLLDRGACERNLLRMASFFKDRPSKLRPHFKNHKCITLAKKQIAAGAVGMTCAKLAEAEVLVEHGFDDVLIANQVVGKIKTQRLAKLAKRARISVAIDCFEHAVAISQSAAEESSTVNLLIEVDIGMGRCGVQPGDAALELVRNIVKLPNIRFAGLQAYEGHLVNVLDREERTLRAQAAMQLAIETRELIQSACYKVFCISGCSSATYDSTGALAGVDEIQAGSYATMDKQYKKLVPEFDIALSVLVRVISRPSAHKAVIDVGIKGAGCEFGLPGIRDFPDVEIPFFLAEEHCVINQCPDWQVGQLLHFIPTHACTTCNLHREILVYENDIVVEVWPIEASGKLT